MVHILFCLLFKKKKKTKEAKNKLASCKLKQLPYFYTGCSNFSQSNFVKRIRRYAKRTGEKE